ncbi:MAG: hypothetical protein H7257_14300 [Taibaiella sp.]|nr:hypothetical protein [Taibaiella sp.]
MKQLLLIILFIAAGRQAWAVQADSIMVMNKWCAKSDTPLLFNTANNVIEIVSHGIPAADLVVKSMDNALKLAMPEIKGDTIFIVAMPYPKSGKRMRLSISEKKSAKPLKIVSFCAADVPQPVATLGNITTDKATRKDILSQSMLRVAFPNSLYSFPYRIKQYTFKARVGGKDISIPVNGFFISKEVTNILSIAAEGTFIEFTDIKATCPQCNPRVLESLKMWIK